jgi:hypothetical protein
MEQALPSASFRDEADFTKLCLAANAKTGKLHLHAGELLKKSGSVSSTLLSL